MTLRVDPATLREYAGELARNSDAARAAREYVQRYGEMKWYSRAFSPPGGSHTSRACSL
jgi:hypothetical protein